MKKSYTAKDIEILQGLSPVQKRPAMYTETTNPNHLIGEVIDNSIDEALNGYCNLIEVTIRKNGEIEIQDNGRGIPVDIHPTKKKSAIELLFTSLHSGAKFNNKNYIFSGGLHGVGISVVNALSETLKAEVCRDKKKYTISFTEGKVKHGLKAVEDISKRIHGTKIVFKPMAKYFDTTVIDVKALEESLIAKAVLCPSLKIIMNNIPAKVKKNWYYPKGIESYMSELYPSKQSIHGTPILDCCVNENNKVYADWGLVWSSSDQGIAKSFVNLIPTPEHGAHVSNFKSGLTDALRNYAEVRGLIPKNVKITAEDLISNVSFILSVKMTDPQFAGQTKKRLNPKPSLAFLSSAVSGQFSLWLHNHIEYGEAIIRNAIENARVRIQKSKIVKRKSPVGWSKLPGKLVDCTDSVGNNTELFLVEGDSAGGSAKQARDRHNQAILPLRGKILNAWELSASKAMDSTEINDISVAIGVEPGSKDCSGVRYDKICILADADSDGAHIATLLCALFLKHFPILIESNMVYVVLPPLYRIDIGSDIYYALTDDERDTIVDKHNGKSRKKVAIQRFKGLGEMNPDQLRETVMDERKRRMLQLQLQDSKATHKAMDLLLNRNQSAKRKRWLEEEGAQIEI